MMDALEEGRSHKSDDFLNIGIQSKSSIEESDDLSSDVSFPALFMSEDALSGGENEMSELSGGEDVVGPLFEVGEEDVVPGRDDSALIDSSDELNDDLLASVVIDDLKLTDVVVLLHDAEEFDQNLGDRLEDDLFFSLALGIDDSAKGVG
jgi:hypothetical protein